MIPLSISFLNPKMLGFLFSTKNSLPGDIRKIKLKKTVKNLIDELRNSKGLRPGSKGCSVHMDYWQHLSLGDLEQNEFLPKSKS